MVVIVRGVANEKEFSRQRSGCGVRPASLGHGRRCFCAEARQDAGSDPSYYDWTGPYVGFHFGYGSGSFGDGTNPLPLQGVFFPHSITGLIGGYQAGYNYQLANGVVLGLEADVTFMSPVDLPRLEPAPFNTTFNYFATARVRVGRAFGNVMPYVTAGVAWGQTNLDLNDVNGEVFANRSADHLGWTAGIGIEHALDRQLDREVRVQLHRPRLADLWPRDVAACPRRPSIPRSMPSSSG